MRKNLFDLCIFLILSLLFFFVSCANQEMKRVPSSVESGDVVSFKNFSTFLDSIKDQEVSNTYYSVVGPYDYIVIHTKDSVYTYQILFDRVLRVSDSYDNYFSESGEVFLSLSEGKEDIQNKLKDI